MILKGLWDRQVDAIIDVKIGGTDADTYKYEPTTALLARWETTKNDNHGKHCHDQQKYFSPFAFSVEGMLVSEFLVVLSQLSRVKEEKKE